MYLLIRTRRNKVKNLLTLRVLFARRCEQRLHRMFQDSRFRMRKRVWFGKWWQHHVKIGIASKPIERRGNISRNIYGSGKTEWFAMTWLEIVFVMCWFWWFKLRWWAWGFALAALLAYAVVA